MRMTGYTKLFGTILASSIWQESNETRIVWITMLAAANKWGVVEAAVPGLAHMAKLSVAETEKALEILAAPDKYSRTPDFDGKRIEVVPGGWQILNHDKYRHKMSADERREYNRQKQAEFRERQKQKGSSTVCQQTSITVNDGQSQSALSAQAEADTKAEAITPQPPKGGVRLEPPPLAGDDEPEKPKRKKVSYTEEFEAFWNEYPRGEGKAAAFDQWKAIPDRPSLELLVGAVMLQKQTQDWLDQNGKYIPHAERWLKKRRWEDRVDLSRGIQTSQPKHKAYNHEDATRGLTDDEICKF